MVRHTSCCITREAQNNVCVSSYSDVKITQPSESLAVQRLGLFAFTAEGADSIPGWGTKIPQAAQCNQKKKD